MANRRDNFNIDQKYNVKLTLTSLVFSVASFFENKLLEHRFKVIERQHDTGFFEYYYEQNMSVLNGDTTSRHRIYCYYSSILRSYGYLISMELYIVCRCMNQ